MPRSALLAFLVLPGLLIAGCGAGSAGSAGRVEVVVSTTQLGDFARRVGGDRVAVTQILKPNSDPHEYEPRPRDVSDTADAELVLESGDDLDRWMDDVVEQSGSEATVLDVSERLPVHHPGASSSEKASTYDPHWWHDPRNAAAAVGEIRDALTRVEPDAEAAFTRNADGYLSKLRMLDQGIVACFAEVPAGQRRLVTDHDAFGYFAARYGLDVVGAAIPSQTTGAETSAGELGQLVALIRKENVRAVFPESSVNPKLAQAIARQTGASAEYTLYGDTLGPAGSPGATYLEMEQANADAMVKGFTGDTARCRIPGL